MKDCKQIEELLEAYADGELNETQKAYVEQHVANCPQCKAVLDEYLALNAVIADCTMQAPEGFTERVAAAIKQEKAAAAKPQGKGVRLGRIAPLIGIGVAAMLCLSVASSTLVKFVVENLADPDISVETSAGQLLEPALPNEQENEGQPPVNAPTEADTDEECGTVEELVTEQESMEAPLSTETMAETAADSAEYATTVPGMEGTEPPAENSDGMLETVPVQDPEETRQEAVESIHESTEQPAPETEMREQLTEEPIEQEPVPDEAVTDSVSEDAASAGFFARIWQAIQSFFETLRQAISRLFGGGA